MNVKNQIFTHHMKAMMEFYCASPSHSYALPVNLCNTMNNTSITKNELLDAYVTSNTPVPSLSPIITSIESKLSTAVNNQQKAANDTIQQLDNNIPMSQVVQDLQQQKSTAKITINQLIEDSYNQLSDFGIQHPTSQAEILKFTRDLGDFTTGLLTSMGTYFQTLGKDIIKWSQKVIVVSAWSSITAWFNNAAHSIVKFFKDAGAAIESAFETLEQAAKAAWNEAETLIKEAIEAGEKAILEPIAKAVLKDLPIEELTSAWKAFSSANPTHIAQVKSDAMAKRTTQKSKESMQVIAKAMEPHLNDANANNAQLQASVAELQPYATSSNHYMSFGIEFQASAGYGLGAEGAIGMLAGIPHVSDIVGYGSVGGSLGVQVGAEADIALVLKTMAPEDTGGVYVGIIVSLEDEVGATAQVQFTFPGFRLSGVSLGFGVGLDAGVAIDSGYTWIF